jgi:murein DD-endopeptidase MepM/ murein hydrolase activator NlpD
MERPVLARHRSPSGQRPSTSVAVLAAPPRSKNRGAHRIAHPGPTAQGRIVVAAVAAGALAAATQGAEQPVRTEDSTLLALGAGTVAFTGLGGNDPAATVLPSPEVLPAAKTLPVPRDTLSQDMTSLAKGQRIAEERAAAAAAAQRAAAEERAAAARTAAEERAAAERATAERESLVAANKVVMPAKGVLTSGFGARWGTTHYGIDIANAIGTPIYATTSGVVLESGPASGFGMWVRLLHADGTISVYGHINESLVSEGQRVTAGEQVATMGNRGQSTGPHLHFEIWLDGTQKVNPLNWLRANGVDI